MVVLAITVAVLGPLLFGGAWDVWFYQALVLLVIACPCALVVSTPVTVVSGLAAAAKHGILVKGGVYLEGGRLLKAVALDKTGTLTLGKPALTDAASLGDMPIEQALLIAASLDEHSTHPVAQALMTGGRERQPTAATVRVEDFGVINGRGVRGSIDGQLWHLGNHRLAEELGVCSPDLEARLAVLENAGKTAIVLCAASAPVAVFGVADTVRPESFGAVAALKALHVEPVMLTGDNPATARTIAGQLGIKVVFLALALSGYATLWMAVFADMGASLLVVFNGLRLLPRRVPGSSAAP